MKNMRFIYIVLMIWSGFVATENYLSERSYTMQVLTSIGESDFDDDIQNDGLFSLPNSKQQIAHNIERLKDIFTCNDTTTDTPRITRWFCITLNKRVDLNNSSKETYNIDNAFGNDHNKKRKRSQRSDVELDLMGKSSRNDSTQESINATRRPLLHPAVHVKSQSSTIITCIQGKVIWHVSLLRYIEKYMKEKLCFNQENRDLFKKVVKLSNQIKPNKRRYRKLQRMQCELWDAYYQCMRNQQGITTESKEKGIDINTESAAASQAMSEKHKRIHYSSGFFDSPMFFY